MQQDERDRDRRALSTPKRLRSFGAGAFRGDADIVKLVGCKFTQASSLART